MSECRLLSDRMPLVMSGRTTWTADEAAHLSACRSCKNEWELVRATSRLGAGMEQALDAVSTSRAVLQRMAQERVVRSRRRTWSFVALAAAATITAVLWSSRPVTRPESPLPVVARLQIPLPELDALQPAELDSVLQTMDEPLVNGSTVEAPELGDLDVEELQSVLDFWEG